ERAGRTWIAITGHGRVGADAERVAFGDDAAVAAGLSWIMAQAHGTPCFVGDAVADPLTGLHAALLAWDGWLRGGGGLRGTALRDVVGHVIAAGGLAPSWSERARGWEAALQRLRVVPQPPVWTAPTAVAPALGADNARLLPRPGIAC
ncbi:MAG: CoA transferase, partial [Algiphilus sp.]